MEEKIKWVIGVIVIILAVWYFGFKDSNTNSTKVVDDGILKVGVILPLSGPTAQFGEIFKKGIEAGLANKNNQNIKIIYEDNQSITPIAVSAFQKLTTVDKVDMIVSIMAKTTAPLTPLAQQNKIPMVVSFASTMSLTSPTNEYVYRIFWTAEQSANLFANRIITQGIKSVALLQAKNEAAQSIVDITIPLLEKAGVKVTLETFQDTDTDYKTQLAKLKSANPEVLAILAIPPSQWKHIMIQVRELKINLPLYDIFGVFQNPGTAEAVGDLANNVYTITTPFNIGDYKQDVKQSIADKTGIVPAGLMTFGLDTVELLDMLANMKKTNSDSITEYLKSLKTFDGISGPYTVDNSRNIKTEILKAKFVDGKFIKSEK